MLGKELSYDQYPVICDSGTGYLKVGRACDNFPAIAIPAMVGRPLLRYDQKIDDVEIKSVMIGDEAAPYRVMLELNHPIEEGIVKDWGDMELVWGHAFKKMNVDYPASSVLMTEAVMNPLKNRVKMAEILFESFGFKQMQIGIQALLSLYAEGRMTSVLLDAGDGVTHCMSVVDGYIQPNIGRMNIAGRHLTSYLTKLLFMRGYAFNSTADFELVREIKEKYCFVSGNLQLERKLAKETTVHEQEVRLPDNTCIKIGRERFECPELMFNPFVGGHEFPGVSEMVFKCINDCPIDTRRSLYEGIMISGGTSMFPGFPTRLQNNIRTIYKENIVKGREIKININIIDPPRRKYNVFIGGCVFAKILMNNEKGWITKEEYKEYGAEQCLRKVSNSLR